jgi:hypothetical protein
MRPLLVWLSLIHALCFSLELVGADLLLLLPKVHPETIMVKRRSER